MNTPPLLRSFKSGTLYAVPNFKPSLGKAPQAFLHAGQSHRLSLSNALGVSTAPVRYSEAVCLEAIQLEIHKSITSAGLAAEAT